MKLWLLCKRLLRELLKPLSKSLRVLFPIQQIREYFGLPFNLFFKKQLERIKAWEKSVMSEEELHFEPSHVLKKAFILCLLFSAYDTYYILLVWELSTWLGVPPSFIVFHGWFIGLITYLVTLIILLCFYK